MKRFGESLDIEKLRFSLHWDRLIIATVLSTAIFFSIKHFKYVTMGRKELKGMQPHQKNNKINQLGPSKLIGTKPPIKEYTWVGSFNTATYVEENYLV